MSTLSKERKTLTDLYQLIYDRTKEMKTKLDASFTEIFPSATKPEFTTGYYGNKRELTLNDYVDLYRKAFEETPPYAINDSDYHMRTESTAVTGTINRIVYNDESDCYYGLFNHNTIMKSTDLKTWEDALKLSVDEHYAFMNADIEFFLFNLAQTYFAEASSVTWKPNDLTKYSGMMGLLKGSRIKEFRYMHGCYVIVVENCLSMPSLDNNLPLPVNDVTTKLQTIGVSGRKDLYFEIVYATDTLEDPKRWKVVTSGPVSDFEGLRGNPIRGRNYDYPEVREFADCDTDYRSTWVILMTNGDYFVSHDKFHTFTDQHVVNYAVERVREGDVTIGGSSLYGNRYARLFSSISHYQYYDVDPLVMNDDHQYIIRLNTSGVPALKAATLSRIQQNSNTSANNNIWVIGGLCGELSLTHDLSYWSELKGIMDGGFAGQDVLHLIKMGKGCTLSRFDFSVVVSGSNGSIRGNIAIKSVSLSRMIPRGDIVNKYELDGADLSPVKMPAIQRVIIALDALPVVGNPVVSTTSGEVYALAGGLYAFHEADRTKFRPEWFMTQWKRFSLDYTIGCGVIPHVVDYPTDATTALKDPNSAIVLSLYSPLTSYGPSESYNKIRLMDDSLPKSVTWDHTKETFDMLDKAVIPLYKSSTYGKWNDAGMIDAVACFSRSRNGFVVAYGDTIHEYTRSHDTAILTKLESVKLIPNLQKNRQLTTMKMFDRGYRGYAANENSPVALAPDDLGGEFFGAPFTVKYSPEANMYFAWETYNPDCQIDNIPKYTKDQATMNGVNVVTAPETSIRFLYSYDGDHWSKIEGPRFTPSWPASTATGVTITLKPFDTSGKLNDVPRERFGLTTEDWTIKDIYTFRGKLGQMHVVIMLLAGWYIHLRDDFTLKDASFNAKKMTLYPLEGVLGNRIFLNLKADKNFQMDFIKKLPYPNGYQSVIITRGADWNRFLLARPLLSTYARSSSVAINVPLVDGTSLEVQYPSVDYIAMENDQVNSRMVGQFITTGDNNWKGEHSYNWASLVTMMQFPIYQNIFPRYRELAGSGMYTLHRFQETWYNHNPEALYQMILQGAMNYTDYVTDSNSDTPAAGTVAAKYAGRGSYLSSSLYELDNGLVSQDNFYMTDVFPGYQPYPSTTRETEGTANPVLLNPLGHFDYNLFYLLTEYGTNGSAMTPVPVMTYRGTGWSKGAVGATTLTRYTQRLPFFRSYGSHGWAFYDPYFIPDQPSDDDGPKPFKNAVAFPMDMHERNGIVTNKGHYYVNFSENVSADTSKSENAIGVRQLPAAVDLSMYPMDYRNDQLDSKMTNYTKTYNRRPSRILTYDGTTIFNYADALLYRNYGSMQMEHDTLIQAYNDKIEGVFGHVLGNIYKKDAHVQGSVLQKENNKLFLTTPTGQLSRVEMTRPADVDDIGFTKCIIDPDTMNVQYGTRRELETKEEWRPIYNADISDPFATNQLLPKRPAIPDTTPNKAMIEGTLALSDANRRSGPWVTTSKDFILIVDGGDLRILSKHWMDGWTDDSPIRVSLNTKLDGTGEKVWILGALILDKYDKVYPDLGDASYSSGGAIDNKMESTAALYVFTNQKVYTTVLNPWILTGKLGTDIDDEVFMNMSLTNPTPDPLNNPVQEALQALVVNPAPSDTTMGAGTDYITKSFAPTMVHLSPISATSYVLTFMTSDTTGAYQIESSINQPDPTNAWAITSMHKDNATIAPDTTDLFRSWISNGCHVNILGLRGAFQGSLTLFPGNTRVISWRNLDLVEIMTQAQNRGAIASDATLDATTFVDLIQDITYNPETSEILFMINDLTIPNRHGLMKYRFNNEISYSPTNSGNNYTDKIYNNSGSPVHFVEFAWCDHMELFDVDVYNHQWIGLCWKAPYTNDRWGSTNDRKSKTNDANATYTQYTDSSGTPIDRPSAQELLHVTYSKDGLNWGEYYNLEITKPAIDSHLSVNDTPYLIVDNERGNCLIYDGAGRILTKTLSRKYALENQVVLGEQTNIYGKAVFHGSYRSEYTLGCDIVIGAVYPEYIFSDSFDQVMYQKVPQLIEWDISIPGSKLETQVATDYHVMDLHSYAISAFDSFNFGVNDRYGMDSLQYPYDIDYNANGRSGGFYLQHYHAFKAPTGAASRSNERCTPPFDTVQKRAMSFYRASNPDGYLYDYPIWPYTLPNTAPGSTEKYPEFFPTNRQDTGILNRKMQPRYIYSSMSEIVSTPKIVLDYTKKLDVEIPSTETSINRRFSDTDLPTQFYWGSSYWKRRANNNFEYTSLALTQNRTTRDSYITLYGGIDSAVLYFPTVGKVWIHLGDLTNKMRITEEDPNYNKKNKIDFPYILKGNHPVSEGMYTYTHFTIIGRTMEVLRTYDGQTNIYPIVDSPYLNRYQTVHQA